MDAKRFHGALAHHSLWERRNYPSLLGLTTDDLYQTLALACCINDDISQLSELVQKARRAPIAIRMCFGFLTDAIITQIGTCRHLPHEDSFFSDRISKWKSLFKFDQDEPVTEHFDRIKNSIINQFVNDPWSDFLKCAYVCLLPVTLMSMGVINLEDMLTTLGCLSLDRNCRLAAIFLLRHPAGMDLVAKLLSIRHRVEEGALSGTVTGDR